MSRVALKDKGIVEALKKRSNGASICKDNQGDKTLGSENQAKSEQLIRLQELARGQYAVLMACEHQRTENYWRLGDYLRDIRNQLGLPARAWCKYVEETLRLCPKRCQRAVRIRKLHDTVEQCKALTLREALDYKPSENVKKAKQAQARAKRLKTNNKGNKATSISQEKPPTDEEKQALKIFLEACGTVERAIFVLETVVHHE